MFFMSNFFAKRIPYELSLTVTVISLALLTLNHTLAKHILGEKNFIGVIMSIFFSEPI